MKNILITTSTFDRYATGLLPLLEQRGYAPQLNPLGRKLTVAEVDELLSRYRPVGMIAGVEPLTREVLQKASGLKVVSRCGIGLDSVDLEAAAELGITVTSTPDAPTVPVAELTLGMILSLLRCIHLSDAAIRRGEWLRPYGCLLHGKTVGIIGCGRIGSCLARLLRPFDCEVLGCDPLCAGGDCFTLTGVEEMLPKADIVSLHIPYNESNHHFINAERLNQMKTGAYLVNTARGGLVDEGALYEVLVAGKLAGAALDGFEIEPYCGPLKGLNNVLMTGHIGSYAREARVLMEREAVDNLLAALSTSEVR